MKNYLMIIVLMLFVSCDNKSNWTPDEIKECEKTVKEDFLYVVGDDGEMLISSYNENIDDLSECTCKKASREFENGDELYNMSDWDFGFYVSNCLKRISKQEFEEVIGTKD
tara:strand:- start:952 stop:1284 length:333 start_codon:yes stop_codon:yes gene_type:complete